jgi:hypothetical protein
LSESWRGVVGFIRYAKEGPVVEWSLEPIWIDGLVVRVEYTVEGFLDVIARSIEAHVTSSMQLEAVLLRPSCSNGTGKAY